MEYIIRRARPSDLRGLATLFYQFWEDHSGVDPLIELKNKITYKSQMALARECLKRKGYYIFVAVMGRKVIGFIEFVIKKNEECNKIKRFGYFNGAVTHKDYRRRGVARKLAEASFEFLKARGIEYVKANIFLSNKVAMRTWQRIGFRPLSDNMIIHLNPGRK